MMAFLALQAGTGLFSDDRGDFSGPLSGLVSGAQVLLFTGYHKRIGEPVLIALVVLHLAAIAYYQRTGRKLLGPMLHGDKQLPAPLPSSRDDAASRLKALMVLAVSAGLVAALVRFGGG
jgi:cytochrome b